MKSAQENISIEIFETLTGNAQKSFIRASRPNGQPILGRTTSCQWITVVLFLSQISFDFFHRNSYVDSSATWSSCGEECNFPGSFWILDNKTWTAPSFQPDFSFDFLVQGLGKTNGNMILNNGIHLIKPADSSCSDYLQGIQDPKHLLQRIRMSSGRMKTTFPCSFKIKILKVACTRSTTFKS